MKLVIIYFVIASLNFFEIDTARILGIFHVPSHSHYSLGRPIMKALAEKGHDVTFISPFQEKTKPPYREIVLSEILEQHEEKKKRMNIFEMKFDNPIVIAGFIGKMGVMLSEKTLNNSKVQELLHSNEKFDMVILEQFFNDALKGIAAHFGASLVILNTQGENSYVNDYVQNPAPISYIPHSLLAYPSKMTFMQKFINVLVTISYQLYNNIYIFPKHDQLIKKYISKSLDINDVLYNVSLVLLNSHPSLNQAVPKVPNMIEIGGYHIEAPKPLPKNLQHFLDKATNGVVYFSMGSNLRSIDLPEAKRNAILGAFSKLKEQVLWKWENDSMPNLPANVKLQKWLPQRDVLAHKNVKLFITHCGFLSTLETIYHGVPILAIPLYGDQTSNAYNARQNGFALVLSFSDLTEETLSQNLDELLKNKTYHDNAKRRSAIMHDGLAKPLKTVIFWIEYVIRHKDVSHLRVAGLDLSWYQYYSLDVLFVAIIFVIMTFLLFYFLIKCLTRLRRRTPKIKIN